MIKHSSKLGDYSEEFFVIQNAAVIDWKKGIFVMISQVIS